MHLSDHNVTPVDRPIHCTVRLYYFVFHIRSAVYRSVYSVTNFLSLCLSFFVPKRFSIIQTERKHETNFMLVIRNGPQATNLQRFSENSARYQQMPLLCSYEYSAGKSILWSIADVNKISFPRLWTRMQSEFFLASAPFLACIPMSFPSTICTLLESTWSQDLIWTWENLFKYFRLVSTYNLRMGWQHLILNCLDVVSYYQITERDSVMQTSLNCTLLAKMKWKKVDLLLGFESSLYFLLISGNLL